MLHCYFYHSLIDLDELEVTDQFFFHKSIVNNSVWKGTRLKTDQWLKKIIDSLKTKILCLKGTANLIISTLYNKKALQTMDFDTSFIKIG